MTTRLKCKHCGEPIADSDDVARHCERHGHRMGGADRCACGYDDRHGLTDDPAVRLQRVQARIRRKELELDKLRQTRDDLAVVAHGEPWCHHDSPPLRVCECGEVLS